MQARSYNDKQLDTFSRSTFYDGLKLALRELAEPNPDDEKLHAIAAALDAAACGIDWVTDDDVDPDLPAGMAQASAYNDDLLNEQARVVYVTAMTCVQAYLQGSATLNIDKLSAYSHLADAAASGFHEDDDDSE